MIKLFHLTIKFLFLLCLNRIEALINSGNFKSGIYELNWTSSDNFNEFNFKTNLPSFTNSWSAFAFSNDNKMGNDDVCLCFRSDKTKMGVERYYTKDKNLLSLNKANSTTGLFDINVSYQNGFLICSFKRIKSLSNDRLMFFDLKSKPYYLLVASGELDANDIPAYHKSNKLVSSNKINFNNDSSNNTSQKLILIILHAVFMVIAWILLSTLGVSFAKYIKYIFPNKKIFNLDMWFLIHRLLMLTVVVFSFVGFLLALWFKDWQWTSLMETKAFVHSILGIITISFAFIQPFIAFLRPENGSKKRIVFNVFHRIFGHFIILISFITIYFGLTIFFEYTFNVARLVFLVYVLLLSLYEFVMAIFNYEIFCLEKKRAQVTSNEENKLDLEEKEILNEIEKKQNIKLYLFYLHFIVTIGFTIALIVIISVFASSSNYKAGIDTSVPHKHHQHHLFSEAWKRWKRTFNKTYNNDTEVENRFSVWNDNDDFIHKHNMDHMQGVHEYELGHNKYSDLDIHEFQSLKGFLSDHHAQSEQATFILQTEKNISIPLSVDWRNASCVNPIQDQGKTGTCYAFSAVAAIEGHYCKKYQRLVKLSEQNAVDCSMLCGNGGNDGGTMNNVFDCMKKGNGINLEQKYPFNNKVGSCLYDPFSWHVTVTGFVNISYGDEQALTTSIASSGPISVGISSKKRTFQLYKKGIYYESTMSKTPDHAVVCIGYGSDGSGKDYYIVRNSWGTSWGNNGYIKMARNKKNFAGIASMASYPLIK